MVNEGAGSPMSDEAVKSVQESVSDSLETLVGNYQSAIEDANSDGDVDRELRGISHTDDVIDYEN